MTRVDLFAEETLSIPQAGQAPATNHTNLERGLAFVAERNWDKAVVEFDAMLQSILKTPPHTNTAGVHIS